MSGIRKFDENPANHKGSIVSWPKLKYVKNGFGGIDVIQDGWNEDILLEPMDYQLLLTLERGSIILSADEAQKVKLIDADLWDDSCEKKLQEFYNQLKEKEEK
jgi:hypothetical protein